MHDVLDLSKHKLVYADVCRNENAEMISTLWRNVKNMFSGSNINFTVIFNTRLVCRYLYRLGAYYVRTS